MKKTTIVFQSEGDALSVSTILIAHARKRTKAALHWTEQGNTKAATESREEAALAQRLGALIDEQVEANEPVSDIDLLGTVESALAQVLQELDTVSPQNPALKQHVEIVKAMVQKARAT